MATDIVGSLFGVSPEMYQQQMNRQALQDAIAMQRLSPLERAGAMTQAGAYMAGQGIGGAFGIGEFMWWRRRRPSVARHATPSSD